MSSNTGSAAVAADESPALSPVQGDGLKVVAFSEKSDYRQYPLTEEAHRLYYWVINAYTDHRRREQTECRRHFIPIDEIFDIAAALERQLTVEDLNILVCPDGDKQKCVITGRDFQPMRWVFVTNKFLDAVKARKVIVTEGAVYGGCFFPSPNRKEVEFIAIAGVPTFWTGKGRDSETRFAYWSPLVKAREANGGRSGLTLARCSAVIAERDQRQQEDGRVNTALGDFFGRGKPRSSPPRHEDWRDDRSGKQRDRRPFHRPARS